MDANLLGSILATAAAGILLWLRQFILGIGRPKQRGKESVESGQGYPLEIVRSRDPLGGTEPAAGDCQAPDSPIQVEEFLAELRAKSAKPRKGHEGEGQLRFTAWPR